MAAQGLSVFQITPSSSATNQSCRKSLEQVLSFNQSNSFVGRKLSIQRSSFSLIAPRRRSFVVATICFSLPTTKTEGIDSDKKPKWSARSVKAFVLGAVEGRKLHYPQTGTEALLMGILVEGTSLTAKFLRENGINFLKVRDETVKLLGKGPALHTPPEPPPLTKPILKAIDWAVEEKLKSGDTGEITVAYLLLGIWATKGCGGQLVLASLGFDDDKAKELAKTVDKDIILSIK